MSISYIDVKNFRRRQKERIVYVMGGKCQCCGYNKCIQALELHHLDPKEKEFSLSQNLNQAWKTIIKELPKTILVCANCHREIEAGIIDNSLLKFSFDINKAQEILQQIENQKTGIKTYCQLCQKEITKGSLYCRNCYIKIKRKNIPDKITLEKILLDNKGNFTQIGKIFGITDNAVRKWCKKYGLPFHSSDYK